MNRGRAFLAAALALVGTIVVWQKVEPMLAAHLWLSWYQSIPLAPLVVVLAIAGWRGDAKGAVAYGSALAGVGLAVTLWHALVEWGTLSSATTLCGVAPDCRLPGSRLAGLATATFVTLVAYAGVLAVLLIPTRRAAAGAEPAEPAAVEA